MVILYSDRRMLEHSPPPRHPERPQRLETVLRHLDRTGLSQVCPAGIVREATREELARVHSEGYIDQLIEYEGEGGGPIEADTWINAGSTRA
ncbi:histone deacetylase family protein, partial [Singulisphaera rosea]